MWETDRTGGGDESFWTYPQVRYEMVFKHSNTHNMVVKGFKRLKQYGASNEELVDVYIEQVRSVLELAVPVWHSSITKNKRYNIERVQRAALHIIMGFNYSSYKEALKIFNVESLETRWEKLCMKFAVKAVKHEKFQKWFKINITVSRARQKQPNHCHVRARLDREINHFIIIIIIIIPKVIKILYNLWPILLIKKTYSSSVKNSLHRSLVRKANISVCE